MFSYAFCFGRDEVRLFVRKEGVSAHELIEKRISRTTSIVKISVVFCAGNCSVFIGTMGDTGILFLYMKTLRMFKMLGLLVVLFSISSFGPSYFSKEENPSPVDPSLQRLEEWRDAYPNLESFTINVKSGYLDAHLRHPGKVLTGVVSFPEDGWVIGFVPEVIGAPHQVLHHMDLFNTSSLSRFCRDSDYAGNVGQGDVMFASGKELTKAVMPLGYGYAVDKGDDINYYVMYHNETPVARNGVTMRVTLWYLPQIDADLLSVYPLYLDVLGSCDAGDYYVSPGEERVDTMKVGHIVQEDGKVVLMGGHLHDFGKALEVTLNGNSIHRFIPDRDASSRMLSISPVVPLDFFVSVGDVLGLESLYHNTSPNSIDAMAQALLYISLSDEEK